MDFDDEIRVASGRLVKAIDVLGDECVQSSGSLERPNALKSFGCWADATSLASRLDSRLSRVSGEDRRFLEGANRFLNDSIDSPDLAQPSAAAQDLDTWL